MNLQELIDFNYEDLNARITSVRLKDDIFQIELECDDPKEVKKHFFILKCVGVVELKITPGVFFDDRYIIGESFTVTEVVKTP